MSKKEIAGLLAKARRSVHAAERCSGTAITILQSRAPIMGCFMSRRPCSSLEGSGVPNIQESSLRFMSSL